MKKKKTIAIKMLERTGTFAENKDIARSLREKFVFPNLKNGFDLIFDYDGVSNTTQSFTHALISEAIRKFGPDVIDRLTFKNCSTEVKKIINIVVEYMQGNMESPVS